MTTSAEKKLLELGIVLPTPTPPLAAYVPVVQSQNWLVVSGQLPMKNAELQAKGIVNNNSEIDQATAAARLCAINVLAQVRAYLGTLDRIKRVVRLGGFIASSPSFESHALIMNGASNLMEEIFGDAGRHARSTIGVSSLPLGAMVEVEALFEVEI